MSLLRNSEIRIPNFFIKEHFCDTSKSKFFKTILNSSLLIENNFEILIFVISSC
jgi:hypothetical protein